MSKHTDGPWNFVVSDEDELVYDITPTDAIGGVVAIAYNEANAKLIAAATELLEACITTLRTVALCDCGQPDCATTKLRGAIDKATK